MIKNDTESLINSIQRLLKSFPGSFINPKNEFVAHLESNTYFSLSDCINDFDVECKAVEYLSGACYKTEPYHNKEKNIKFHEFMTNGLNTFLSSNFDRFDLEDIYTYIGNGIHHKRTVKFVSSGFDKSYLYCD